MGSAKTGLYKNGETMHYSVGALIRKRKKYLLIDRMIPPYGFAGPAGHIDEGETPEQALGREIKEETGLILEKYELAFEETLDWNICSKGINIHHWYLYKCETSGKPRLNPREAKSIGWYSTDEIKKLKLEPVWEYWFKKLGLI